MSHTTAEFRDAASNEIVYYRDTDGQWTPEKGEVSRPYSPMPKAEAVLKIEGEADGIVGLPRLQGSFHSYHLTHSYHPCHSSTVSLSSLN